MISLTYNDTNCKEFILKIYDKNLNLPLLGDMNVWTRNFFMYLRLFNSWKWETRLCYFDCSQLCQFIQFLSNKGSNWSTVKKVCDLKRLFIKACAVKETKFYMVVFCLAKNKNGASPNQVAFGKGLNGLTNHRASLCNNNQNPLSHRLSTKKNLSAKTQLDKRSIDTLTNCTFFLLTNSDT